VSFILELFKDKWRYILFKRRNNIGDVFKLLDNNSLNYNIEVKFYKGLIIKNTIKLYKYI
jgi:hypothetical protein